MYNGSLEVLDNGAEIEFYYDELLIWDGRQQLVDLSLSVDFNLNSVKISDLIQEDKFEGVFFKLENYQMVLSYFPV